MKRIKGIFVLIHFISFIRGLNTNDRILSTLQNQFANDETVSSYALMAKQCWNNYQTTQNIASSCAQVISYVDANPVVMLPFTTTMDKDYQPKDFCPIE